MHVSHVSRAYSTRISDTDMKTQSTVMLARRGGGRVEDSAAVTVPGDRLGGVLYP